MNKRRTVIYGTGKYASVLYQRYQITDRTEEIAFFLVSDMTGNERWFEGKQVFALDEKKDELDDKEIIIALSPQYANEVKEKLGDLSYLKCRVMTSKEYQYRNRDLIEYCKYSPIVPQKILFFCLDGVGYSCNCKYIAQSLLNDGGYDLVWIINKNDLGQKESLPCGIRCVELFSIEYYKEAYSASIIISNENLCPGIVKRKGQYYINTWHGIGPFKKVAFDLEHNIANPERLVGYAANQNYFDLYLAGSDDCINMYRDSMKYKGEILKSGYPRNDIFFNSDKVAAKVKAALNICEEKKVILYAPTFRGANYSPEDSFKYYDLDLQRVCDALEKRFSGEFVLLYRMHRYLRNCRQYEVFSRIGQDVSDYPDAQELLAATDVLITDYSSIMWDFSLMKRPVFLYHNDVDDYSKYRGFYAPVDQWPYPQGRTSEELCNRIRAFDDDNYRINLESFFAKYGCYDDGHATERVVDRIRDVIDHPEKFDIKKEQPLLRNGYFYSNNIFPRVSVIVPVYNGEKYLRECLNSILAQTLKEIEVICIDDGSTDSSGKILDEYASRDSRICVIHNKNYGYGHAVNVGIDAAHGEYVGIVESDDTIVKNMYEKLYFTAVDNNLDMVKAQCYYCWDSIGYRYTRHVQHMDEHYNKVLTSEDRDLFWGFFMNTWSGIYRRAFLDKHNIRHHESKGASFQDNGFWILTVSLALRAMWISDQLYLYRRDNEKQSINGDGKVYAMTEEYDWVEEELRKRFVPEKTVEKCHYYRLFRNKGNFLRIADVYKKEFATQIFEDYKKYRYVLPESSDDTASMWYRKFIDDPIKYTNDIISKKRDIIQKLDQASAIVILGTTYRGELMKQILFSIGFHDKLEAFIQPGRITRSTIGATPVRNIYDPQINLSNALIILGQIPSALGYEELKSELSLLNLDYYLEGEDLLNCFYNVF